MPQRRLLVCCTIKEADISYHNTGHKETPDADQQSISQSSQMLDTKRSRLGCVAAKRTQRESSEQPVPVEKQADLPAGDEARPHHQLRACRCNLDTEPREAALLRNKNWHPQLGAD